MQISRQSERHARFHFALTKMPMWETWDLPPRFAGSVTLNVGDGSVTREIPRDFKAIPRRKRRKMARDLARREYAATRGR